MAARSPIVRATLRRLDVEHALLLDLDHHAARRGLSADGPYRAAVDARIAAVERQIIELELRYGGGPAGRAATG